MERKKVSSIKWSLFLHLAVALILSTSCSVIVNTLASHVEDAIWLKSVDNISEYYEIYNEYSKLFGGELSIPPTQLSELSKADAVIIGICDFAITWCSLIFTSFSVLIILTRFYKKRLKKPLVLLEDSAMRIGNQDLNFRIDYRINDEMGQLCTAFEKMREQLWENNKAMWKAIEEQKQMRAAFSHDLRTPMSVLKAYIEYLNRYFPQGKLTNEKVMEVVNDLDEQILRIDNTMKEINYLEEIRPTKSCIDSCTIEKKTRKILETLADKGKKNYKVSYQCDISEMYLDLNIYLEIVENVVANAVRFANRKISAELYSNKNQLYVIICDDGPGFKQQEIDKATKPYYHGGGLEETHYGMGLYISDVLCRKHGGKLILSNLTSGGACVKIIFENVKKSEVPDTINRDTLR